MMRSNSKTMGQRTRKRVVAELFHQRFYNIRFLWRSAEDRAWLDLTPVGREFGSPDYERLARQDAEAVKAILATLVAVCSAVTSMLPEASEFRQDTIHVQKALKELGHVHAPNMKIALYSDIHLERQSFTPGPGAHAADVIVLAGDIGHGTQGLEWARNTFKDRPIVMVLGNHEFFGGNDFFRLVDTARRRARELDIALLECEEVSIGGVRFLGVTLWTDFELFACDPDALARLKAEARKSMRDYSSGEILAAGQGSGNGSALVSGTLTPDMTIQRHWQTQAWLEKALADGAAERTVVVTHHCPSLHSIPPQFRTGEASKFSPMYASDLSYLGDQCALWLHGHVHASAAYEMHGTRAICNPKGYNSLERGPQNPHFTDLLIEL